jgi:dipeptidyl-peptidase-4
VTDTFPRQYARTRRLTLGDPRDLTITPDGARVLFARSRGGSDPLTCLWSLDTATGEERLLLDPAALPDIDPAGMTDAERAQRERRRESAEGVTSYACDAAVTRAVCVLGGDAVLVDTLSGRSTRIDLGAPVFDPRLSADGHRLAVVRSGRLCVVDVSAALDTALDDGSPAPILLDLGEPGETVQWGVAEFIAAEEMGRMRGHWWSPDGTRLAVCRVDESPVAEWTLTDPASPWLPGRTIRYPAAGAANAEVALYIVAVDGSAMIPVPWDRDRFEYLARVSWDDAGPLITLQSRDQRTVEVHRVDPATGSTRMIHRDVDEQWVELVAGCPVGIGPDTIVTCRDLDGARRLEVAGGVVTPTSLQVRSVVMASATRVVFHANPIDDPTVQHLWEWTPDTGARPIVETPGVTSGVAGPAATWWRTATLDDVAPQWCDAGGTRITTHVERPLVDPVVHLTHTDDGLDVAVLLPSGHSAGDAPLPVLLDPYGGPHARRVVRSATAFANSQWFADQGFAVVVCDGRGTPGRGSAVERAVAGDLASGVLADQVAALGAAADLVTGAGLAELDLGRVGVRGWSFGGYLAALAVLRRPDVFHAAVAGAPVTEWRWYDTHYTERYLGHPDTEADAYDRSSLVTGDITLERPLLLIHGLADDNVVAAHTLRLSSALLAAGAPHEVLPLVGVSHMTPQEVVAENLLLHQLDFLRRALGPGAPPR